MLTCPGRSRTFAPTSFQPAQRRPIDERQPDVRPHPARTARPRVRHHRAGTARPGAITANGRARRRRRRSAVTGLSAAGLAASVVLALGLTGVFSPAGASSAETIRTAAFTLTGHPNGTATLTINPQVLFDPATLQQDLASDGIPAVVTSGQFCASDPTPAGFSQVVVFPPMTSGTGPVPDPSITLDPAAVPSGTELSIGEFPVSDGQQAVLTLVTPGAYSCSSTMPTTVPPGGALLHLGINQGS